MDSLSMAVKSRPSTSPARRIAARLRICVTRCTSATFASARASDHPSRGTLTHSGLAASARINTRGFDTGWEFTPKRKRQTLIQVTIGVTETVAPGWGWNAVGLIGVANVRLVFLA